jgi:DNA-binding MarR family transcriptional regulator
MVDPRWLNDEEFRAWIGYRRMRLLLDAELARDLMRTACLSFPDYDVLSMLSEAEGHRQRLSALAARMQWSKGRLSRHVSRMEHRGLVTRVENGSSTNIVLTAEGKRALVEAAPDHVVSVRSRFIDLLTEQQLRVLGDIAEIVLAKLPRT